MARHRLLIAIGAVTLIAGIAMTAVDRGVVVVTIGLVLLGIGGVLLVSLAFLIVGESEDRHRERHPGG
jgi:dipeptide/tripeptide permease